MIIWGVSAGTHDASLTVVKGDDILFASHSERYSRIKNDAHLNDRLIADALSYGEPEKVYWYENPILKAGRKIYAGQNEIWLTPKSYLKKYDINTKVKYIMKVMRRLVTTLAHLIVLPCWSLMLLVSLTLLAFGWGKQDYKNFIAGNIRHH